MALEASGPATSWRLLSIALLGVIVAASDARTARGGCHVADRPATLGRLLDEAGRVSPAEDGSTTPRPDRPIVSPAPCRDETPRGVEAPSIDPADVVDGLREIATDRPRVRCTPESHCRSSMDRTSRLDRPPRALGGTQAQPE